MSDIIAEGRARRDRTLEKFNDPEFINDIAAHVANGGALTDFCQTLDLRYSDVVMWIYGDAARKELYEKMLNARGEWFIQSILSELRAIGMVDLRRAYDEKGNLLPISQMPADVARVIAGFEVDDITIGKGDDAQTIGQTKKIKLWDKLRALELLGKNLRMFVDQVEHTGKVTLEELVNGSMKPDAPAAAAPGSGQAPQVGADPASSESQN